MRLLRDPMIAAALRCPICRSAMEVKDSGSLLCLGPRTHCFDFGASGYVNLSRPGQSGGGDSKQAVRARSQFLNLEHYRPVADGICALLHKHVPKQGSLVLDAGCGEGYYSEHITDAGYAMAGFDLSKAAVDAASKRASAAGHVHAFYGVASVYELPVADGSVSAVTNVFAPCAEEEYARVLCAGDEHLMGLKRVLYAETHRNSERADLPLGMEKIDETRVKYAIAVEGSDAIANLFTMTPYYWRTSPDDAAKLAGIERLETEVDVLLTVYQKKG